eukprot:m.80540 g.80540  ORF g.80540 m.80540 type:complete len:153 (-) comp12764_c1_seq2:38-496(-)
MAPPPRPPQTAQFPMIPEFGGKPVGPDNRDSSQFTMEVLNTTGFFSCCFVLLRHALTNFKDFFHWLGYTMPENKPLPSPDVDYMPVLIIAFGTILLRYKIRLNFPLALCCTLTYWLAALQTLFFAKFYFCIGVFAVAAAFEFHREFRFLLFS